MEISELIRAQSSDSIFSNLTEKDWDGLFAIGKKIAFKNKQELFAQGDFGDKLLILLEGRVRISIFTANGREISLDYVEAGSVLGEIAMLDGDERTASVFAMCDGIALEIHQPALREYLASHSDFSWVIMQTLARRLRQANQIIESDRAYSSAARLARCLLRLRHVGENDLQINLNQTELGNFAGMSREHINRQLKSWEAANVIALEHGRVRILEPDTLEEICESDC